MNYDNSRWKYTDITKKDKTGFHFAKNSNFLRLPINYNLKAYQDEMDILIDYKNIIHFINQEQKTIDIFEIKI